MGIIERLFKKTKETDKKLKLSLEYKEKYIKIILKIGDKTISLKDLKDEIDISSLSKSDIFEVDENGNTLLLD